LGIRVVVESTPMSTATASIVNHAHPTGDIPITVRAPYQRPQGVRVIASPDHIEIDANWQTSAGESVRLVLRDAKEFHGIPIGFDGHVHSLHRRSINRFLDSIAGDDRPAVQWLDNHLRAEVLRHPSREETPADRRIPSESQARALLGATHSRESLVLADRGRGPAFSVPIHPPSIHSSAQLTIFDLLGVALPMVESATHLGQPVVSAPDAAVMGDEAHRVNAPATAINAAAPVELSS